MTAGSHLRERNHTERVHHHVLAAFLHVIVVEVLLLNHLLLLLVLVHMIWLLVNRSLAR